MPYKGFKITEKGYKGGLVSRVVNKHSGNKYVISTAKEIGKDYWSTVVAKSRLFGLWMDFSNKMTWIRNTQEDANKVHADLKTAVENVPESDWISTAPTPRPSEGYSKDATETLKAKLGFDPEDRY